MEISERLTWPQIRERYPDQWAVLVEHDGDESGLLPRGHRIVLAPSAPRATTPHR